MIDYQLDSERIATLTINMEGKTVNTLCAAFVADFNEIVERLSQEQDLAGVILTSSKADFMAGGDIDELFAHQSCADLMAAGVNYRRPARQFETLGLPCVAVINGSALGGGCELSLLCHHRVLWDQPRCRIGFPEITLGLFPGGGGCLRLPRMIGLQKAMEVILEGKLYTPQQAQELGLVDEVVTEKADLMVRARAWIKAHPDARQAWDLPKFRWPGGSPNAPANAQMWMMTPAFLGKKTWDNYPNQQNAVSAIYEGSLVDFDTADRIENRLFANTVSSQVAKNMITAFWYQLNHIKKGGRRPKQVAPVKYKKVGILGAGMMGSGIAYSCATAGLNVVLQDKTQQQAEQGKAVCQALLERSLSKGRIREEKKKDALEAIQPSTQLAELTECELVIEAVFEDRALKGKVTAEAEAVISEDALFASNTSTLPITSLAENSKRPDKFIGLHFFSPVDKMQLVEIIVGKQTSDETLARAYDFVLQINKIPIVVNDSRGFYTSRVFGVFTDEGMAMVGEGIHPRTIETAAMQAGMPVGPLAVVDEVSLSLVHHIRTQTRADFKAANLPEIPKPSDAVLEQMMELKRHGKKATKGFYDYEQAEKKLWSGLAKHFPISQTQPGQRTLMERLMFCQALETIRCLEEGVLRGLADANLGSILGWGFAPFKGGTCQYINDYGLKAFNTRAQELAETYGDRFLPPQLLIEQADSKDAFEWPL